MKKIKLISFAAIIFVAIGLAGCQKTDSNNSAANNTNKTVANTNSAANTTATSAANTDSGSVGSLATPTDAYKTAYDCRKRKDIDCLKKVMSKDILDFLKMMDEDDKKSLDDMLNELCDRPQAATAEARNEKIDGDSATLEYLDQDGKWKTMDFEKVSSEWKMGAPKARVKSDGPANKP